MSTYQFLKYTEIVVVRVESTVDGEEVVVRSHTLQPGDEAIVVKCVDILVVVKHRAAVGVS